MAKLTLNDIGSGYAVPASINENSALIEAAIENTLSRDGTVPNEMEASLSMGEHPIINLGAPGSPTDAARLKDITEGVIDITGIVAPSQTDNNGKPLTTDGTSVAWGNALLNRTQAEINAGVVPSNYAYPPLDVRRYGAVGDNFTDNLAAFDAALDVAVEVSTAGHGAEIFVPEGKFRFSDEWNVYRANSPRRDVTIRGVDQLNSVPVANFFGANKSLIKSVDPAGITRSSPISIRDLGFENVDTTGGVNPVFINVLGMGESRLDRVRFGASNNTHVRLVSAQNVRGTDIVSFFGGRNFNYKNTSGFTFSVDTATNRITASASIFDAGDVGKHFFITPANSVRRIRYTISAFVSNTVVEYSETTSDLTETNEPGHFEPARCTMTDNDATLTANAAVFTSDMVGLVLYIRGASTGSFGAGLLRATITSYTSPTQVELDTIATEAVTDAYFGVAVFDMGIVSGFAGSSDVQFDKLHIESYSGIGFAAQNTDSYQISGKIHGDVDVSDTAKSMAALWLDDFGGRFELVLGSSTSFSDTRIHISNMNDLIIFDGLWTRHIINGTLIKSSLFTTDDGYVVVSGFHQTDDDSIGPENLISDANFVADATDPRILFAGVVNMAGDSQLARTYVARGTYFAPDGRFTTRLSGSAAFDPLALLDGEGVTTTVTVTGAALGDFAQASFANDLQGITLTAWVSAADTVSVRFQNESGGTLNLAQGTLRVRVN